MNIKYTPPEVAAEIVGNRLADDKLQQKLTTFLGGMRLEGPYGTGAEKEPPAVRAEYLARPTRGDLDYIECAVELGFEPWTVSYQDDEFTASNEKKANMLRPRLALPKNQMAKLKIANSYEGYPIGSIPVDLFSDALDLGSWWQLLRAYVFERDGLSDRINNTYDISQWYTSQACLNGWETGSPSKAAYYYPKMMGLYAARAALFCDYSQFKTFQYAEPAFDAATEALGVEPIIVKWQLQETYPQRGEGQRPVQECEVDLTDQEGLTYDKLPEWLEQEVL